MTDYETIEKIKELIELIRKRVILPEEFDAEREKVLRAQLKFVSERATFLTGRADLGIHAMVEYSRCVDWSDFCDWNEKVTMEWFSKTSKLFDALYSKYLEEWENSCDALGSALWRSYGLRKR
jgi:hypothetical protein